MEIVPTQAGYDRWAEFYDGEDNPLVLLEEKHLAPLAGDVAGLAVADIGCGMTRTMKGSFFSFTFPASQRPISAANLVASFASTRGTRSSTAATKHRRAVRACCASFWTLTHSCASAVAPWRLGRLLRRQNVKHVLHCFWWIIIGARPDIEPFFSQRMSSTYYSIPLSRLSSARRLYFDQPGGRNQEPNLPGIVQGGYNEIGGIGFRYLFQ
jgi:hypothetical protein